LGRRRGPPVGNLVGVENRHLPCSEGHPSRIRCSPVAILSLLAGLWPRRAGRRGVPHLGEEGVLQVVWRVESSPAAIVLSVATAGRSRGDWPGGDGGGGLGRSASGGQRDRRAVRAYHCSRLGGVGIANGWRRCWTVWRWSLRC
jgi:hypothetical protein